MSDMNQLNARAQEINHEIANLDAGIRARGIEVFMNDGGIHMHNTVGKLYAELNEIQQQAQALQAAEAEAEAEVEAKAKLEKKRK